MLDRHRACTCKAYLAPLIYLSILVGSDRLLFPILSATVQLVNTPFAQFFSDFGGNPEALVAGAMSSWGDRRVVAREVDVPDSRAQCGDVFSALRREG